MKRIFLSIIMLLGLVAGASAQRANAVCGPYVQCVSHVLNITLYVQMVQQEPKQWTYLIYTVYALVCGIVSAIYMHRLYNKQKTAPVHE